MHKILVVEDDAVIGQAATLWLEDSGRADWCRNIADARTSLLSNRYDIVILDIGLPDGSGFDLLQWMRRRKIDSGVIIITAYGKSEDRIKGLDTGADDYLVKPLDFKELDARIRAVMRRKQGQNAESIEYGPFILDLLGKTLTREGEVIKLSAMEFSILSILLTSAGRYYSRALIAQKLYSTSEPAGNSIEVHISSLRRKLGKDVIKTARGLGYIIEKEYNGDSQR